MPNRRNPAAGEVGFEVFSLLRERLFPRPRFRKRSYWARGS